jgi:Bacterial membrane protein YfhO
MFRWLGEKWWRVPALLVLFTIFFYWKILLTNRSMFPWDANDFFYPTLGFVHEELRHFRLPLWNPYNMSGFPIIADPEAQIFYPPTWLLALLDPFWHLPYKLVEAELIAHFFLAGLFMYWLAKDFTKDTFAALLGGVLFMSSGGMVAHTEHVATIEAMAWYPLVFLLARRGLLEKNWRWTISAGFFLGVENLTGHWQHAVYLGLLLFLYFSYEACFGPDRGRLWPHWMVHLLTIGAIGAGLAMIQIVPTSELSPLSIRTQLTYRDITDGNYPRFLWTLILPNFFGGLNGVPYREAVEPSLNYVFLTVPGLLLALVGLIQMGRRRNFFWLGMVLLAAELSLGNHGYLAGLVYRVPPLNLFRQMVVFFDLANFSLCLMAAIGVHALIDPSSRGFYGRWLSWALLALLACATAIGLVYGLGWKIPGYYHMVAVLAVFSLLIAIWTKQRLSATAVCAAILALVVYELCFYSMNQIFNRSRENPRTFLSYYYASDHRESLEFLRQDTSADFRVAALDGSPWGSNGCNIWRLPCIFGWNPMMLRGYREYVRQFAHISNYAIPWGETGHSLDSPLLDLLGVKYLLAIGPIEQKQHLAESAKFKKVFAEPAWRAIFRNQNYFPRAWYFPTAAVLPDRAPALAVMSSEWFQPRKALILARPDLFSEARPSGTLANTLPLTTISLGPEQVSASRQGTVQADPNCAEVRSFYADWGEKDSWIQFNLARPPEPGRYAILAEYTDAYSVPALLQATITQQGHSVSLDAVELSDTSEWECSDARIAELGEADLTQDSFKLRLTSQQNTPVNLYSLWLVRLPDASNTPVRPAVTAAPAEVEEGVPPRASNFLFSDYAGSANRISFHADLPGDGFVLVNELFYPGWEATIDGKPAEILKADTIFRALQVPSGSHEIEMRFRPRHFWIGALISLLTLAGLLVYFFLRREPLHSPP